jgi:hypothetical protein
MPLEQADNVTFTVTWPKVAWVLHNASRAILWRMLYQFFCRNQLLSPFLSQALIPCVSDKQPHQIVQGFFRSDNFWVTRLPRPACVWQPSLLGWVIRSAYNLTSIRTLYKERGHFEQAIRTQLSHIKVYEVNIGISSCYLELKMTQFNCLHKHILADLQKAQGDRPNSSVRPTLRTISPEWLHTMWKHW